jgi:hypothetical protein
MLSSVSFQSRVKVVSVAKNLGVAILGELSFDFSARW